MSEPVPRHLRNPRRAYDADGREIAPPSIADCRAKGETTAAVYCEAEGCHHDGIVSTDRFPADLPFPDIALHVRCSKCGGRNVRVMMDMKAHYERIRANGGPDLRR